MPSASGEVPKINRVSNIIICDDCLDRFGQHACESSKCTFFMIVPGGSIKKELCNLRRYIVGSNGKIKCLGTDSEIFGG